TQLGICIATRNFQRQCDIFSNRQMVQKFTILMHNTYSAARICHLIAIHRLHVGIKNIHLPRTWQKFHITKTQQSCLTRPRRSGQKMKRPRRKTQAYVFQDITTAIRIAGIRQFDQILPNSLRNSAPDSFDVQFRPTDRGLQSLGYHPNAWNDWNASLQEV
ncbi:MAG: hypothetical protein ACI875_001709, partial [Planctomycetota bacterium]